MSSRGHKASGIRWDDLQFERGYDKWKGYGQAKTANVLFAVQLDKLASPHGVRAFSVYPGGIQTPLQRHLDHDEMVRLGWFDRDGNTSVAWKFPEQGAPTSAWAATSPQLTGIGGVYCEDCDVVEVDTGTDEGKARGVSPWAIDPDQAARNGTSRRGLPGSTRSLRADILACA